ncbi:MAG TPA: EAL domain-containing protein [Persephonella sp.]|nr:EAL domain-containing protein [Persephonella sp.]
MKLSLAVCSHDTENKKNLKKWQSLAKKISDITGEEISFQPFKNCHDELENLVKTQFDIYYANPFIAYRLYKKGYKPIGKFKNEKDSFVLIGYLKNQDNIKISSFCLENHIIPILYLEEVDFAESEVVYTQKHEDIYTNIKTGKADIGLMYKKNYDEIKDKDKIPIIREISTNMSHFVMVKSKYYEKVRKAFYQIENFEPTDEIEFLESFNIVLKIEELLKIKEFFDISEFIYEIPFIGVIIYKEKIKYANKYTHDLLKYSEKELQGINFEDIISSEFREKIKPNVEKVLRGEYFSQYFENIKLRAKNGQKRYVFAFSKTVLYKGEHARLFIFVDITKQIKYQKLYKVLRSINKSITTAITEKELYKTVCETLVKELGIKFAWIGALDEKGKSFNVIHKCGEEQGYLQNIKLSTEDKSLEEKGPVNIVCKEGKIFINPDTENNPAMAPWKAEMLKRGFLSSVSIPIKKYGKVVATINIYSSEKHFFEEENISILKEIESDLSFALEKIDIIRNSIILKKAVKKSDYWVIITDEKGKILYVNDFVVNLTGYKKEELIGQTTAIFKSGYHSKEFYKQLWETILSGKEFSSIFVNRKKNGEVFYIEESIIPIELEGNIKRFISIGIDITKEKKLYEEVKKLKFYNIQTNLYNFNGFLSKVEEILKKEKKLAALAIVDIREFTYINKTYGIKTGDLIIKQIAKRLKRYFRKTDILGKIGGDEFAILFADLRKKEDAFIIEEKINKCFQEPFRIDGTEIKILINAGIAIYPDDGKEFYELYENASTALLLAKKEGANVVKFFSRELENKAKGFVYAKNLVERAIEKELFIFFYQPYFKTSDLSLVGFEALARIKDENGKIYSPYQFIDYLEHSPYLDNFRQFALEEITEKINRWNIPISVNVSARSFKDPMFAEQIIHQTKDLKKPLILEITERVFMEDIEKTKELIQEFTKYETVKVSIDDFGTGYSSLSYLKDLNADILKIDMSFIRQMLEDKKSKAIVEGIIHIAKSLGMLTVAEGVETKEQLQTLKQFECDYVQGFLLKKPMPEEEVEEFLKNNANIKRFKQYD